MQPEEVYPIFLKWYAMPATQRTPRTIPEFCEHLDIDPSVISNFQDKESFTEDLYRAARDWGKSKIPELLHLLYSRYKERFNVNDLRMYKELIELDKEKNSGPSININVFNPSDDQYRQIIARESRSLFGPGEGTVLGIAESRPE